MNVLRTAALVAAALAPPGLVAQEQERVPRHLLRLTFEVGKTRWLRESMSMHMAMGDRITMSMKAVMTMETRVERVQAGRATLAQTMRRLVFELQGPPRVAYDSDDPDAKPGLMKGLADLVGKTIRLAMDERGRISDVQLPEDYEGDRNLEIVGGMSLEEILSQGMPEFPDLPVPIGGTWTTEREMPVGRLGVEKIKFVNKLLGVADGKATLGMSVQIDTGNLALPGGAKLDSECERSDGISVISLATGQQLDSTMEVVTKTSGPPDTIMMASTRLQAMDPASAKGTPQPGPDLPTSTRSRPALVADVVLAVSHVRGDEAACAGFADGRACVDEGHWRATLTAVDGALLGEPLPAANVDVDALRKAVARTASLPRQLANGAWVPDAQLVFRADRRAPYGVIQRLLEVAAGTGVCRIALAVHAAGAGERERVLETPMPAEPPARAVEREIPEIRIDLSRDGAGTIVRSMGRRRFAAGAEGDGQIDATLQEILEDYRRSNVEHVPGIIDAEAMVPWQDVVHVIDAFRAAGIDSVQFARAGAAK